MLSDVEGAVLAEIDEAGIGRTLLELISVPSVTGSAAESELQHLLAGRLERLGLDVDLWSMDLDALRADPDFPGTEAEREEAWGLVGVTEDGGDGPAFVMQPTGKACALAARCCSGATGPRYTSVSARTTPRSAATTAPSPTTTGAGG